MEDEDTEEEWREGEEAGGEGIDEDMTALVKEIKFQRTRLRPQEILLYTSKPEQGESDGGGTSIAD